MAVKNCHALLKTLDPEDAAAVVDMVRFLVASGIPGPDAWTQAAELVMEEVLLERNELAAEIREKGGSLEDLTIENLLNPASYKTDPNARPGRLQDTDKEGYIGSDNFNIPLPTVGEITQVIADHPLVGFKGKVKNAYIVGSFAGGIPNTMSDVDVMLEVNPRKGMTEEELTERYRKKLQQYMVTNNIRERDDSVHPQWDGRRVDIYFTYNAEASAAGRPIVKLPTDKPLPLDLSSPAFFNIDDSKMERRTLIKAVLGAASIGGAVRLGQGPTDTTTLGRATSLTDEVVDQKVPDSVEKMLRADASLPAILKLLAKEGPKELQGLAATLAKLIPKGVIKIVVDDTTTILPNGDPIPHGALMPGKSGATMTLYTKGEANGLTVGTVLHESIHAAIAARYYKFSVSMIEGNYKLIGMEKGKAIKAQRQLERIWNEFKRDVDADEIKNTSVLNAYNSPDEFFIRALTDPAVQGFLAAREYKGKTLLARFIDWVKFDLFGYERTGEIPSWLDAALLGANEMLDAMAADSPDFSFNNAVIQKIGEGSASEMARKKSIPQHRSTKKQSDGITIREEQIRIPGKVDVNKIAAHFDKLHKRRYRRKGSFTNQQDIARAKKHMADEVDYQLTQEKTGKGWYDEDVHEAMVLSEQFVPGLMKNASTRQLMTVVSGILSNGNKANLNWAYAIDIMRTFSETGKIETKSRSGETFGRRGQNIAKQLTGLGNALDAIGVDATVEFLLGVHTGREIRAFKKKYWGTDRIEGRVQMDNPFFGARIFGPKIGSFAMALNGVHGDDVVMDVWATRTMTRHMGKMLGEDGTIVDSPLEHEREAFTQIVSEIAADQNLEIRDVQAILWYFEQQLFSGLGARNRPESFADGARTYIGKNGGIQPTEGAGAETQQGTVSEDGAALITEPATRIDQARHRRNVTNWLSKSLKRLQGRVPFVVKNDPSEVDFEVPASAAGYKYDGVVYLFKDNIRDQDEAVMAVVHEAIGHLGLEGSLGHKKFNELIGDVLNLRVEMMMDPAAHPQIRDLVAELKKHYVDKDGNYSLNAREEAREILAHIAHSKKRIGRFREIYNKIMAWVGEWAAKMGLADPDMARIETLMVRATSYVMDENRAKFTDKEKGAAMVAQTPEDPDQNENPSDEELDLYGKLGEGDKGTRSLWKKIADIRYADIKQAVKESSARWYEGLFDGLIEGKRLEKAAGVGLGRETYYMTPKGIRKKTKDFANSFYVAARLATGISDMMTHLLNYGSLQWDGGVVAEVEGTRGFLEVLGDLGKDNLKDWLVWMAGHRAEELMAEGREHNLTLENIIEAKSKNLGKEELFKRIKEEYNEMNRHQLDFAEEAGLIDAVKRAEWESEWYVPFYRQSEEGRVVGPTSKRGLSHQSADIRRLLGAKTPTGELLENIMTNWIKLVDAGVKNHALRTMVDNFSDEGRPEGQELGYITNETLDFKKALIPRGQIHKLIKENNEFAVRLADWLNLPVGVTADGIFDAISDLDSAGLESLWQIVAPTDPDVIRVQRGGKNEYWRVHVPGLLRATGHIKSQGNNSRGMRAARWFKTLLTMGVTTSPDFMMRNFIRDAVHSWAINKDNMWFLKDSFKGLHGAVTEGPVHRAMMAAGASFQGGYVHGTDPEATAHIMRRELIKSGWSEGKVTRFLGTIVDNPAKLSKVSGWIWQHYRNQGDRIENASRVATAQAGIDAGKPAAQWLFESKDLMDYSRRGNFAALIFFTDVMPFLNARVQGLDKLGRAWKEDKIMVTKKMAMIAAFSVWLAMLNDDDDDYQELPDWEKDAYWHLFPPGPGGKQHIRIPKPFEIGFLAGTMPERMYRAWYTQSQPNEKVIWALQHGIRETLNINFYPQIILPLAEVKANRHFYFDQPIETLSDQNVVSSERYNRYTSETAITLGDTALAEWVGVSPKQLQHLWNGYTGTMGAYLLSAADIATGRALSFPKPEETQLEDLPLVKSIYKGQRKRTTQWQIDVYDRLKEVNELYGTLRKHIKAHKPKKAKAWFAEHRNKLGVRKPLEAAQRIFSKLRDRRDFILANDDLTAAEKYQKSQAIQLQINAIAKKFESRTREAFED